MKSILQSSTINHHEQHSHSCIHKETESQIYHLVARISFIYHWIFVLKCGKKFEEGTREKEIQKAAKKLRRHLKYFKYIFSLEAKLIRKVAFEIL